MPLLFKIHRKLLLACSWASERQVGERLLEQFCEQLEKEVELAYSVLESVIGQHRREITPFLASFVLVTVRAMCSANQNIQRIAMQTLGDIMACQLITPEGKDRPLQREREGREFTRILANPSLFETEAIAQAEASGIELRDYQKEGIKWLSFLVKYGLSGALCDDMGLGKTVQTLAVLNHVQAQHPGRYSLVVCPPTLLYHWQHEQREFFGKSGLEFVILEAGATISKAAGKVFLTSYSNVVARQEAFAEHDFLFIVLDEGHAIRNPRVRVSKAIKSLRGRHRILLSGTPIQNTLIELWSIFEFLMKGYLGDDESFRKRFHNLFKVSIVSLEEDKLLFNEEQRERLEQLHRKTAPFILRRTKGQVLTGIPPKVVRDYECVLTQEQV